MENSEKPGTLYYLAIWKPIPPQGYTCLGHVVYGAGATPGNSLIRCVKSIYVKEAEPRVRWVNFETRQTVIEEGVPKNSDTLVTGNFIARVNPDPRKKIPMIDLRYVRNFNYLL